MKNLFWAVCGLCVANWSTSCLSDPCNRYDTYTSINLKQKAAVAALPVGAKVADKGIRTPDGNLLYVGTGATVSLFDDVAISGTSEVDPKITFHMKGSIYAKPLVVDRGGAKYSIAVGSSSGDIIIVEMPEQAVHSYHSEGAVYDTTPVNVNNQIAFVSRSGGVQVFGVDGSGVADRHTPLAFELGTTKIGAEIEMEAGIYPVSGSSFVAVESKRLGNSNVAGSLQVINLADKKVKHVPIGDYVPETFTVGLSGNMYYGTHEKGREFYSRDANGAERFKTALPCTPEGKPVAMPEYVMVSCSDMKIYKIDANTGKILASYSLPERIGASLEYVGKEKSEKKDERDVFALGLGDHHIYLIDDLCRVRGDVALGDESDAVTKISYVGNGNFSTSGLTRKAKFFSVGKPNGKPAENIAMAYRVGNCEPGNSSVPIDHGH